MSENEKPEKKADEKNPLLTSDSSILDYSLAKKIPTYEPKKTHKLLLSLQQVIEIFQSIFSSDKPTRYASFLFSMSFLFLFFTIGLGSKHYWELRQIKKEIELKKVAKAELEKKEIEIEAAKSQSILFKLGEFTLALKEVKDEKLALGVMNMAEIEIVLLCSNQETYDYFNEHGVLAKNQIMKILLTLDREELMSREGKKKMKKMMMDHLNDWLPHGKIEDIFFSKLLLM